MVQSDRATISEPSFRERLPDRLAVFGAGLAGGTVVGLIAGAMFGAPVATASGYTMVVLGAICLLGGGLTGGGYSQYGIGEGIGRNHYMRGDRNQLVVDRLRDGYDRPAADPGASWLAVAGLLYLGIGLLAIVVSG